MSITRRVMFLWRRYGHEENCEANFRFLNSSWICVLHGTDFKEIRCLHTGCPTRYRTRHFFNNFTTNEDIATKFEADLPHCVRNVTTNVLLFKFRSNIFIDVRIIKEMSGSVASGTPCISYSTYKNVTQICYNLAKETEVKCILFHVYCLREAG